MDERNAMLMNFMLNETKHLRRFTESSSPFKSQKKSTKPATKALMKGQFLSFSKMIKQFRPFYFELYPNCLLKYQDKTKPPPVEQLQCQSCTVTEENEVVGEQVAFGIIISNTEDNEIAKLVTDKFQLHKLWLKALKKYCKVGNFLQRFKVENRIFDHFYRCIDKKKRAYVSVKIVNKKGLKPEQKLFVENEIEVLRRVQCNLLPKLKKVYEDENYIYLTFAAFNGDDLLKIVCTSSLEEIAVATLTYHILKGLRSIHAQNAFHGNLKLENIIFSTGQKENEIFVINFKFIEETASCIEYRDRLIKRGQNNYVAPEVIEGKQFDSQIDLFSLGVCLFYMVFQKFPYAKIERIEGDKWEYELDISILEQMFNEKKKDPSSHQDLSVSGIDFLLKLLSIDPDQRPTAAMALNHHWFINFTNKPTENKKLQKFREAHQMTSLKTILECSELSERELDSASRLFFRRPFNNSNLSNLGSNMNNNILTQSTLYYNNDKQSINQMPNTPNNNSGMHANSPISLINHNFSTRNHINEDDINGRQKTVSHDENDVQLNEDETEEKNTVDILMHKLDRQTPVKWLHPRFSAKYFHTESGGVHEHFQDIPHLSQFAMLDKTANNGNSFNETSMNNINSNNIFNHIANKSYENKTDTTILSSNLNNSVNQNNFISNNRMINNISNANYFEEQPFYQPSSPTYQSPHYTGLEPIIEETTDLKQSTTFRNLNSISSRHQTAKTSSIQQQQQQQSSQQYSPFQQQYSQFQPQISQGSTVTRTPSTKPSNSGIQQ